MIRSIIISLRLLVTLIMGFIFLVGIVTLLSNLLFYHNANGSLISLNNDYIGSKLIGQNFSKDHYFHSRPVANTLKINNIISSSPYDKIETKLDRDSRISMLVSNQKPLMVVPTSDMVTYSNSALDPHISIKSALYQVARIAKSRNINEDRIRILIEKAAISSLFSEEPIINVLELNVSLDTHFGINE